MLTLIDPKPVVLEIAKPAKPRGSDDDKIAIILNQGYPVEQDVIKINDEVYNVSGMMRVAQDGSIYAGNKTDDPKNLSYRFTQYHLDIPVDRTSVQPNAIVLESQLLPHHFVHWDVPSREVRCQPYNAGGALPSIDINSHQDQQFVWIIPTESSNQLALQTYGNHYYLEFTGADLKATLHVGSPSTNNRFRFNQVQAL